MTQTQQNLTCYLFIFVFSVCLYHIKSMVKLKPSVVKVNLRSINDRRSLTVKISHSPYPMNQIIWSIEYAVL